MAAANKKLTVVCFRMARASSLMDLLPSEYLQCQLYEYKKINPRCPDACLPLVTDAYIFVCAFQTSFLATGLVRRIQL